MLFREAHVGSRSTFVFPSNHKQLAIVKTLYNPKLFFNCFKRVKLLDVIVANRRNFEENSENIYSCESWGKVSDMLLHHGIQITKRMGKEENVYTLQDNKQSHKQLAS